ncbi:hypothetical protein V4886_23770, partial [Ralstonia solanacearum species complex bacterium RW470]
VGIGLVLGWYWVGIGLVLGWYWVGIGLVLGWYWVGIGLVLGCCWMGFGVGGLWSIRGFVPCRGRPTFFVLPKKVGKERRARDGDPLLEFL